MTPKMRVSDLIEELKEMPPDAFVCAEYPRHRLSSLEYEFELLKVIHMGDGVKILLEHA